MDFEVVFVTAYSNYAIRALNLSASYYILKPILIDELIKALRLSEQRQALARTRYLFHDVDFYIVSKDLVIPYL